MSLKDNAGFSLLELIITMAMTGMLLTMVASQFLSASRLTHDERIIIRSQEKARALLDILSFDLRMAGAGMPLSQEDFTTTDPLLSDAPLAILTSSDIDTITLRYNSKGVRTILSADYSPTAFDLDFTVSSVDGFSDGDIIYFSDLPRGGETGMKAEVSSIAGNTITIDSAFTAPASISLSTGSTVDVVSEITFDSPIGGDGVTRDSGNGPVLLMSNSDFSITYLDNDGGTLSPPLTAAEIENELATLELTVTVTGDISLKDGSDYIATAQQNISIRNLVLN